MTKLESCMTPINFSPVINRYIPHIDSYLIRLITKKAQKLLTYIK